MIKRSKTIKIIMQIKKSGSFILVVATWLHSKHCLYGQYIYDIKGYTTNMSIHRVQVIVHPQSLIPVFQMGKGKIAYVCFPTIMGMYPMFSIIEFQMIQDISRELP